MNDLKEFNEKYGHLAIHQQFFEWQNKVRVKYQHAHRLLTREFVDQGFLYTQNNEWPDYVKPTKYQIKTLRQIAAGCAYEWAYAHFGRKKLFVPTVGRRTVTESEIFREARKKHISPRAAWYCRHHIQGQSNYRKRNSFECRGDLLTNVSCGGHPEFKCDLVILYLKHDAFRDWWFTFSCKHPANNVPGRWIGGGWPQNLPARQWEEFLVPFFPVWRPLREWNTYLRTPRLAAKLCEERAR